MAVEKKTVTIIWSNDTEEEEVDIKRLWKIPDNCPVSGVSGYCWDFSHPRELTNHTVIERSIADAVKNEVKAAVSNEKRFVEQDDGSSALK